MSFTDQKPFIATEHHVKTRWGLDGRSFRCYLCGRKFVEGDTVRWVYSAGRTAGGFGLINFMTCAACDGPDVLERWVKANEELHEKFWWAV